MKKIAPIALVALFALTSCKKKWTCECTFTTNGVSTTLSAKDTEKRTKKDAKKLCEEANGTFAGTTTECKLK